MPLLDWREPILQLVGFIASFLATGAVGFRYAAARDRLARPAPAAPEVRATYAAATQRAAVLGLLGAVVQAVLLVATLPGAAAHAHTSVRELVTTDVQTAAECA